MKKKYAIIGFPLTHSHSPLIHNYAFTKMGVNARYEKLEIHPATFEEQIIKLKKDNYSGFNITIPFKEKILKYIDHIDAESKIVGAINTISVRDNKWHGFNTDVAGFYAPLADLKRKLNRILILGTGGAARAVTFAAIKFIHPQKILIAGRSVQKADALRKQFIHLNKRIIFEIANLKNINNKPDVFDLLVNATQVGMYPDSEKSPLSGKLNLDKNAIVYDLIYNPLKTKLLVNVKKDRTDLITINGIDMLIGQANASFYLWHGNHFDKEIVKKILLTYLETD